MNGVVFGLIVIAAIAMISAASAQEPRFTETNVDGQDYPVRSLSATETDRQLRTFDSDLLGEGFSGHLKACSELIDVPVGPKDGNHSYGGFCTLLSGQRSRSVFICDDEMIGHFALVVSPVSLTVNDLAEFVIRNCYGG